MKLIVGLGNPGRQYAGTRHNVGFDLIARVSARLGATTPRARFQGEVSEATLAGEKVLLLTPLTFMNLSGGSVLEARDFFKIACEDVLVICDDLNLPLAKLRFRSNGSAGGQKGLADVIRRLGTEEIPRLRFGIGSPPPGRDVAGFVLAKFSAEEKAEIEIGYGIAENAICDWIGQGIKFCMNKYNG